MHCDMAHSDINAQSHTTLTPNAWYTWWVSSLDTTILDNSETACA
jgi:hypothetical protein